MSTPDVTVVVPVFNTMPYLERCMDSLLGQTLGTDRLQIVAVDDGSTDGSGELLDRCAAAHPGTVVVVHQENSGGPAAPCNAGLDLATGRYVYFIGADDYLGEEALERLVEAADAWDADVVFGRMVGVGGRYVHQDVFAETRKDLDLYGEELPFALSNTKLFRRSLLEEHGIRYPLGLRIGSDQPFTVAAMARARRISVLADYDYYFAVKRETASNISYATPWQERLSGTGALMDRIADILPAGERRDAVLRRHFVWELNKLLRADFLALSEEDQVSLAAGVGELCDRYLTEGIARSLWASARSRMRLAQAGDVARLRQVIALQRDEAVVPLHLEPEVAYSAWPGFRDSEVSYPDSWYEVTRESTWDRIVRGTSVEAVAWKEGRLQIRGTLKVTPGSAPQVSVVVADLGADGSPRASRRVDASTPLDGEEAQVSLSASDGGARFEAVVDPSRFASRALPYRAEVFLRLRVGSFVYDRPVYPPEPRQVADVRRRLRRLRYVAKRQGGALVLVVRRPPSGKAAARKRSTVLPNEK
ncbi:glycosyltransferase family 2 protein [Mumia quercus]|uniref:glycosyltransferase family 2 protein n=1 Tax=Mumia quercus TaxID=2976125 RepID=UPI0021D0F1EC|nr:glycosyltransferase [Mumia quercus]